MLVRMLIFRVGVGCKFLVGEEYDLPEDEAKRLIAAGKAEPVTTQETAMLEPAKPRKRAKKGVKRAT